MPAPVAAAAFPLCKLLLGSAAVSAVGGAAKAGLESAAGSKQRKHEKDLAQLQATKPGFENFGDELVNDPRLSLLEPRADFSRAFRRSRPFSY